MSVQAGGRTASAGREPLVLRSVNTGWVGLFCGSVVTAVMETRYGGLCPVYHTFGAH